MKISAKSVSAFGVGLTAVFMVSSVRVDSAIDLEFNAVDSDSLRVSSHGFTNRSHLSTLGCPVDETRKQITRREEDDNNKEYLDIHEMKPYKCTFLNAVSEFKIDCVWPQLPYIIDTITTEKDNSLTTMGFLRRMGTDASENKPKPGKLVGLTCRRAVDSSRCTTHDGDGWAGAWSSRRDKAEVQKKLVWFPAEGYGGVDGDRRGVCCFWWKRKKKCTPTEVERAYSRVALE